MNEFNSPLESYLDPGERLLWSSQPKQGVRLQASDALMIPFSLMWGGFAIFWEMMALGISFSGQSQPSHPDPKAANIMAWVFPLWGVPFVLVGLYMIFGRFFYDAALRKRTYYGVTDHRLIILKSLFLKKVTSFDHNTLSNLNLVERGDHSGDIIFGSPGPVTGFGNQAWPGSNRYIPPGFYLLPDARSVYNLIRDAQKQSRQ